MTARAKTRNTKSGENGIWKYIIQRPHTLMLLLLALFGLYYMAFKREEQSAALNTKAYELGGIIGGVVVFLFFCMVQLKDSHFSYPHPAFWRMIMGLEVIYLVFLVWLLFQTPEDARGIWKYLDPSLGVPLKERDYASDCRILTLENPESRFANVKSTLMDEFVMAHIFGWFIKSFLFRDLSLCWAWSLLFEYCEISLAHILPNFNECWWDHLVLDILICNSLGFYLGHFLMYFLNVKLFNWIGVEENNAINKWFRIFLPYKVEDLDWQVFSSLSRFFSVIFILALAAILELNCFFLKYVLWHPPSHYIVVIRLLLMWFFCLPALREYYEWTTDKNCVKLGINAWLIMFILSVEMLVWLKFSKEMFLHAKPCPQFVIYSWCFILLAILAWPIYFYFSKNKKKLE